MCYKIAINKLRGEAGYMCADCFTTGTIAELQNTHCIKMRRDEPVTIDPYDDRDTIGQEQAT